MEFLAIHLLVGLLLFDNVLHCQASLFRHVKFVLEEVPCMRLCSSKNILTVNGMFPGPTIYVTRGETIIVNVYNKGNHNITLHWHGVKQPRNPWADGPEYITQCPIQPGRKFRQKVIFSDEEGTLWWHAHSKLLRDTVHGMIVIHPPIGSSYPFPKPYEEVPIIIGEWWKKDVMKALEGMIQSGGEIDISDAYTINSQPGDLYPCSKAETFKLTMVPGKTYLLRIIGGVLQDIIFFSIANHTMTVVGTDGFYVKPLRTNYIALSPGQTMDVLLEANQQPDHYYMAARVYSPNWEIKMDNTTTTAIIQYTGDYTPRSPPFFPNLPYYDNVAASVNFTASLRSLADKDHPIDVPQYIDTKLFMTVSVNTLSCPNNSCAGPNGTRLSASMNNISFVSPSVDILEAYYYHKQGVFSKKFPSVPPLSFNFTNKYQPLYLETPKRGTEVKIVEYNSTVEIVFQGTSFVGATDHPMHIHGYTFYVVGRGIGNFDKDKDPLGYNLVDPPLQNTIALPINGWTTIRFRASNPGVWFIHCHIDRHLVWGMDMVLLVKNGKSREEKVLPPPPDMPPC